MVFGKSDALSSPTSPVCSAVQSASYVASVDEYVKSGDPLRVRILSIDRQKGQFTVTLLDEDEKSGAAAERETGGEPLEDGSEPSARSARGRGGGRGRGRGEGRGRADGRARGAVLCRPRILLRVYLIFRKAAEAMRSIPSPSLSLRRLDVICQA